MLGRITFHVSRGQENVCGNFIAEMIENQYFEKYSCTNNYLKIGLKPCGLERYISNNTNRMSRFTSCAYF